MFRFGTLSFRVKGHLEVDGCGGGKRGYILKVNKPPSLEILFC